MADTHPLRLLHFADLHLDVPFRWAPAGVARRHRQAVRDALRRILELAVEQRVDAVLCAGDLYEQDHVSPDTIAFLVAELARIAPIPVVISPGNHDWYGPRTPYQQARWPANVTLFRGPGLQPLPLRPGVTLWGAAHQAPASTPGFLDGFRVAGPGLHLGLFHGAEREDHRPPHDSALPLDPHAPFAPADIEQAGLLHALTGHYHSPRDAFRYTYPGNPEPLTFGEEGARGPILVTVYGDGKIERTHHPVGSASLSAIRLDVTGCASEQDVRERVQERVRGRAGAVRIDLEGELPPAASIDPAHLADAAPWLEALLCRASSVRPAYDLDALSAEATVRGQFVRDLRAATAMPGEEERPLDEATRWRVLVTGLRALDDREDLDLGGGLT
ncbi:MAG: DNA repair exonuclease [Candidatus Dormiibacterota bacterium]